MRWIVLFAVLFAAAFFVQSLSMREMRWLFSLSALALFGLAVPMREWRKWLVLVAVALLGLSFSIGKYSYSINIYTLLLVGGPLVVGICMFLNEKIKNRTQEEGERQE